MSTGGSVTRWLQALRGGDPEAAQRLWERYYQRLVGLARTRLRGVRRAAEDEEDVAVSAFESFRQAAAQGRFPRLADRNDLWRLLVVITARKACDLVQRGRRGGVRIRGGSALLDPDGSGEAGLEQVVGDEPTPAFAAQVAEECQRLLDKLDEVDTLRPQLRDIAVYKMEGYTNEEIAAKLDCALTTVERRLRRIRKTWEDEPGA